MKLGNVTYENTLLQLLSLCRLTSNLYFGGLGKHAFGILFLTLKT
jgi:hypothetical protein